MNTIACQDDRLRIHFDTFDMDGYGLFLRAKRLPEYTVEFHPEGETYTIWAPARFAPLLGIEVPRPQAQDLPLSSFLFDDQREIVSLALDARRFACWSDCGLGKTLIGLEWARHVIHRTGGRVLIVTHGEIARQWQDEAIRFYGDDMALVRLRSRTEMKEWCRSGPGNVAITNYEKWNPEDRAHQVVSEAKHLAGIALDESSRLKTGGGRQKWALIHSCKGIEYKLSLTATPAPNDVMEFASQASFLEKMRSEGEILWTYFVRDSVTHRWTVKRHAREDFFAFMASWSIYVRDPKRYGWRLDHPEVPEPVVQVHEIPPTAEQREAMAPLLADPSTGQQQLPGLNDRDANAVQACRLSQLAKGFLYRTGAGGKWDRIPSNKPPFVHDLVAIEVLRGPVLVWTTFDAESALLLETLEGMAGVEVLTGKTAEAERAAILDRYRSGQTRVLITRASVLGWGMNLQHVKSMIFSGWSFSYESYYQAVRRAYRHGQTARLRVHIPVVPELEGAMLDALWRKQAEHEASIREMELNYIRARRQLEGR